MTKVNRNQKSVHVRMPVEEYLMLDAIATKHDRSMNWAILHCVRMASKAARSLVRAGGQ